MYEARTMNELALFAGAGGGILGGKLLGWRTVCAVENDAYARSVLLARQRDGMLPRFPIWDDVRTFDGRGWRGQIDVVTGGFPCQDISPAGFGAGINGKRSGLWTEMARILGEVRPRYALVENSAILTSRGLNRVLGDLAEMGFDARWGVLGACHAGLDHQRKRIWIAANAKRGEWRPQPHYGKGGRMGRFVEPPAWDDDWLAVFTRVRGTGDGVARNVDRTDTIRNGQVPAVAAMAWEVLAPESFAP